MLDTCIRLLEGQQGGGDHQEPEHLFQRRKLQCTTSLPMGQPAMEAMLPGKVAILARLRDRGLINPHRFDLVLRTGL